VRPFFVEVFSPCFDDDLSFNQRSEAILVEAFVSKLAVEAFDERVVVGLARPNKVELDACAVRPRVHDIPCELRAVVAPNRANLASQLGQSLEHLRNACCSDAEVDFDRQALVGEVVDDRKHLKPASALNPVPNEVDRPHLIGSRRHGQRHPHGRRPLDTPFAPQRQLLLDVDALHALLVDRPALSNQHLPNPKAPEPPALRRDLADFYSQRFVQRALRFRLVLPRGAVKPDDPAGLPLRQAQAIDHVFCRGATLLGP